MPMKPYLKQVRRFSQLICLLTFLFLFRRTDYSGTDTIPFAVNLFFRLDPLVPAVATLAMKIFVSLLWPAFITIALTLVCPLGTFMDISDRFIKPRLKRDIDLKFLKYGVLTVLLISSSFGVQFLGFADPFSLLVRGLAFSLDPMMNYLVSRFFDAVYAHAQAFISNLTEPVYQGMKWNFQPSASGAGNA